MAFDTNILVYAAGVERHANDLVKIRASRMLLRRLQERTELIVPVQALGELFTVLTRFGATRDRARRTLLDMIESFLVVESSTVGFLSALDLATTHNLQFWDALILNAAAEAGCAILLSEDMGDGFAWRGTVVVNPLADTPDERLTRLLA